MNWLSLRSTNAKREEGKRWGSVPRLGTRAVPQ